MKLLIPLVGFLFGLCPSGTSQIVLNQGDVYTHSFSSLTFIGVRPNTGSIIPSGYLHVAGVSQLWLASDTLRLELFENDILPTPLQIGLVTSPLEPNLTVGQGYPSAWQDLQGAIRLSSDSGTFVIDRIILEAFVPIDASRSSYNYYRSEFVPVPEPSAVSLLVLSISGSVIFYVQRLRQSKRA